MTHHTDDQELLLAVLDCKHTIDHESITLRFNPKQDGYNALAQLHNRLRAYDQAARQRELQLLSEIEALERLALRVLPFQTEKPSGNSTALMSPT